MVASSGGTSIRSIFSSSLMRDWTCLALVAWARKRLMKASNLAQCPFVLVAVGVLELRFAVGLLDQIFVVIAVIEIYFLVPEFHHFADGDVKEITVVRDQDVAERVVGEVRLQPIAGFQVEVIGGLVEQQQVGFFKQQLGESEAHLPAAGEFLGVADPVFLAEAKTVEHRADLGFDGVTVAIPKLAIDVMKAVGGSGVFGTGGVELSQTLVQGFEFALHVAQVVEDGHAFGEDGAAGEREAVLREVTETDTLGKSDGAVIEAFQAAEDLQQRRFTGAVGADQAGAFLGGDQPIAVVEQKFGAESFSGALKLNHRWVYFKFSG